MTAATIGLAQSGTASSGACARTLPHIGVDVEPRKIRIDPYNKLIDRNPKDNVVDVK